MTKTTLKEIKLTRAIDVTHWSNDDLYELRKVDRFENVSYSLGANGINGALFKDANGNYYKVVGRSSALFILL